MPYIRHESLFTLQELYKMEQKDRFREIFSTVDITPVLRLVRKTSQYGAPIEVNYRAMVYSLIVRIVERIPTIKDLIKRLQHDILFRLDCGFMLSEAIPSASSYSRLVSKISQSQALEEIQEQLIKQAIAKNSDGKNVFWYGYKGHLVVGTQSQYILGSMLSSGSMNDGKAAIPQLKGLILQYPNYNFKYATMDAGYDYEPVYKQVREAKAHAVIAYNRRREPELVGFDEYFAPTCVSEHSYRYDSYDAKYETLK